MISRRLILSSSRSYSSWTKLPSKQTSIVKKVLHDYDNYFPRIVDKTLANISFIDSAEVKDRVKRFSEYYLVGRYPVQGEFMAFAYDAIAKPKNLSDELLHKMQVVVSTVEMAQTYFFFWDDLEDDSDIRCGKKSWHLLDDTGSLAFNDACIMRSFIDEIVRHNFDGRLRDNILEIYSRLYFIASTGQYFDTMLQRSKNYETFTMQQYDNTNKYKSSFYAIKSPLLLALALNDKLNKETYKVVDSISNDIGILVQVHNDLIDFYNAKGEVTGKSGTDIQEGKCCWTAVAVLENCNAEQKRIFMENYGSWEPGKVARIHQLYEEMDLQKLYEKEEKRRLDIFLSKVNELPKDSVPSADFFKRFYSLVRSYTQDTTTLMYDKH